MMRDCPMHSIKCFVLYFPKSFIKMIYIRKKNLLLKRFIDLWIWSFTSHHVYVCVCVLTVAYHLLLNYFCLFFYFFFLHVNHIQVYTFSIFLLMLPKTGIIKSKPDTYSSRNNKFSQIVFHSIWQFSFRNRKRGKEGDGLCPADIISFPRIKKTFQCKQINIFFESRTVFKPHNNLWLFPFW